MTTESTANILIVDDDPMTLGAFEALLHGPGRAIVKAGSGEEALRCLLREDFALILLDVRMPGLDGLETAALIRRRERSRYTPIIFLSAADTLHSDVLRGVSSGGVDYLFKPVVPEVLKTKVSVFVDLFHANERLKQKAIRQSEERFRLLVDGIQDYAIFMLDPMGRVTSWNPGAELITGYSYAEIIGESFACFFTPEDQARGIPTLELGRVADVGQSRHEGWRVRKDGSCFWASSVMNALRDERGVLVGYSKVTRDLTEQRRRDEEMRTLNTELERRVVERTADLVKSVEERKKLEEQLWHAQKMESIGTLAAGIAHNFNNILGVILGYAVHLGRDGATSKELVKSVTAVRSAVERGRSLVQQLLTFARKTEVVFEKLDVNTEVADTVKMLAQVLPERITVSLELAVAGCHVSADRNQLQQALLNICINARDAMPEGGTLCVTTAVVSGDDVRAKFTDAPGEAYVSICVRDTGIGMEQSVKGRLFEPFFTTKDIGQGTGLGLAVTYGIMIGHGGYVDVESEVGRGSEFSLYFPVEPQPAPSLSA